VRPFAVGPRVANKMLLTDCFDFCLGSPLLKLTEKDSCYESTRNKLIIISICYTDYIDVDIEVF